jgi:hypothetical protein
LAYEVVQGNRHDPRNALQWDKVVLNLLGQETYTPLQPWVYRVRQDGAFAGATLAYVDDLRPVGNSKDHCFSVAHQTASRLGYLGIQNASRKTRPPSQTPDAWASILAQVSPEGITISTSQEKWDKAKEMLQAIRAEWEANGVLNHKLLEQCRGFFIHLQRVYPAIAPFLKVVHLTLDWWRPGQNQEGWRLADWDPDLEVEVMTTAAETIEPVTRFSDDLESLELLFSLDVPPLPMLIYLYLWVC